MRILSRQALWTAAALRRFQIQRRYIASLKKSKAREDSRTPKRFAQNIQIASLSEQH
jgi:hypothetical protein